MTILLAVTGFDAGVWRDALAEAAPDRTIVLDGDAFDRARIDYVVAWKPRPEALDHLPNLKCVFSIGAGVDHILNSGATIRVPIVRMVAEDLTKRMSEYVVWQVLDHLRQGPLYRERQAKGLWLEDRRQRAAGDTTVGIMGLGELGRDAGRKLAMMGFSVMGWSRTAKTIDGITCLYGEDGLDTLVGQSDFLVCLLPLTEQTRGIIHADLLARTKRGAVLINAGRGGLQRDSDIADALDSGQLSAASLDVFEIEPLPTDSPLWSHPRVTVTPHAAACSMQDALAPQMVAQMVAFERGEPLRHIVDPVAGY